MSFKIRFEPCCCGKKHPARKKFPHHKDSTPMGFCEGCSCKYCSAILMENK